MEELLVDFKKHKKLLVMLLISVFIIIVVSIVVLKILSDNKFTDTNQNENILSYTQTEDSQNNIPLAKEFKLADADLFTIDKYTDLNFDYCDSAISYPIVPINVEIYRTKQEDINFDWTAASVFKNMSNYANNDKLIKDGYGIYNRVLNNEYSTEDYPSYEDLYTPFPRPCTGSSSLALGYISKFEYPGARKAYFLIYFGATQSPVNSTYFPLASIILAKVGEDYALINLDIKYDDVTKTNTLSECEENSNGFPMIETHTQAGKDCVIKVMKNDLDNSKINDVLNHFRELYKLVL